MQTILGFINSVLLAPALPVALMLCGAYFIVVSRGFPFLYPAKVAHALLKGKSAASSFRSLSLALAGTLGVGNITGVAAAIAAGGAGALFWMWISALAAMMIKFCEIALALDTRIYDGKRYLGGAMYYIKSKFFARVFAFFCLLTAFSLGCVMQVKVASDALVISTGTSRLLFGIIFAGAVLAVISGGASGIKRVTAMLIPFLTIFYIILSLYTIIKNRAAIPEALSSILRSAFGLRPALGGAAGLVIARAIRYGTARGLITNESGCGSAPMAHAGAVGVTPAEQGVWGMFEVFVDTILLCTLTGLALLTSGVSFDSDSMVCVFSAFAGAGKYAELALALSIVMFAFATVICWFYYGGEALSWLAGHGRFRCLYPLVFTAVCFAGAFCPENLIWQSADFTIGVMTLINISSLFKNRKRILCHIDSFLCRSKKSGKTDKG